jgi:hypothetical protein
LADQGADIIAPDVTLAGGKPVAKGDPQGRRRSYTACGIVTYDI